MADHSEALASHLINQIRSSLAVLEQLNVVQAPDADLIRSKLPPPNGPFPSLQRQQSQQQSQQPYQQSYPSMSPIPQLQPQSQPVPIYQPTPQPPDGKYGQMPLSAPPPSLPPPGQEGRGRALWDYNGAEADDLRFRAGDLIIIDEEVNEQWYRGRVIPQGEQYPRDHQGLFPSNYIEKIYPNAPFYKPSPQQPPQQQGMVPYQPPGPPMYNPPYAQPPVITEEQKKNKLHKIGSTLGYSAVHGVGWGAGTAFGSGLINKIF